jgi:hypothetical protein
MLRGVTAREKGVVYLESEAYTYQRTTDSKQWSVFGSPVRGERLQFIITDAFLVAARVWRVGFQLQTRWRRR